MSLSYLILNFKKLLQLCAPVSPKKTNEDKETETPDFTELARAWSNFEADDIKDLNQYWPTSSLIFLHQHCSTVTPTFLEFLWSLRTWPPILTEALALVYLWQNLTLTDIIQQPGLIDPMMLSFIILQKFAGLTVTQVPQLTYRSLLPQLNLSSSAVLQPNSDRPLRIQVVSARNIRSEEERFHRLYCSHIQYLSWSEAVLQAISHVKPSLLRQILEDKTLKTATPLLSAFEFDRYRHQAVMGLDLFNPLLGPIVERLDHCTQSRLMTTLNQGAQTLSQRYPKILVVGPFEMKVDAVIYLYDFYQTVRTPPPTDRPLLPLLWLENEINSIEKQALQNWLNFLQ